MDAQASKPRGLLMTEPQPESTRTEELRSFAFLAVVMAPILAVVLIASYGFAIWFYQMIIGGPPHA
jgi:nitrate reductase NapE